jgi:hypothetical protein
LHPGIQSRAVFGVGIERGNDDDRDVPPAGGGLWAKAECVVVGGRNIEVARVRITEAGRRVLVG